MKHQIPKDLKILSTAFLFLFAGYSGVQQYITTYFNGLGTPSAGYISLILVFLFFSISNPLAAVVVSKFGAKKSMLTASIFYILFILSLATKSIPIIYVGATLIGISASFLWTGQGSYLARVSTDNFRGKNSGFFSTLLFTGQTLGVLIIGFLISKLSYELTFFLASGFAIVGFILLLKIRDVPTDKSKNQLLLLRRAMSSKTAWNMSVLWVCAYSVYGLAIGIVPLQIERTLGLSYVGVLSSLFYVTPIFVNYGIGRLSDMIGRKKIIIFSFFVAFAGILSLYISNGPLSLIIGVILIALYFAISYPITLALIGDVSTSKNVEYLTAFFLMIENIGVVASLILSNFIQTRTIYIISLTILGISFMMSMPIFLSDLNTLRDKIAKETE